RLIHKSLNVVKETQNNRRCRSTRINTKSRNQRIIPVQNSGMNNAELRGAFLIEDLFKADAVKLVYSENDRAVIGPQCRCKRNWLQQ
ncbi:MAG: hypothetical protein ONB41_15090, partial [candidate division KSB1 bacterium]|nr:hypothetical protein [candidate division KSB1 bacterium]